MDMEPRAEMGLVINELLDCRRQLEDGRIRDYAGAAAGLRDLLDSFFTNCVAPAVAGHTRRDIPARDTYPGRGLDYMRTLARALRDAADKPQKDSAVRGGEDRSPFDDLGTFYDNPQRAVEQKDVMEMCDMVEEVVEHTLRPDIAMSAGMMLSKAGWYASNGSTESMSKYAQESLEYYDEAIRNEPANVLVCMYRAAALDMLDRAGEIISMVQKAEETKPGGRDVYSMSLILHIKYGEGEDIARLLEHENAASLNEEECVATGGMLIQRGISEEGLVCIRSLIGMCPENPELRFVGICMLMGLDRYDEAADRLEHLTELDPSYDIGDTGAMISHRRGRHSEALEMIKAAIQKRPNDTSLRCSMAFILHESGRSDEALECVNYVLKRDAANTQGHTLKLYMLNSLDRRGERGAACMTDAPQTDSHGARKDMGITTGPEGEDVSKPVTEILGMRQDSMNLSTDTGHRGIGKGLDEMMRQLDENVQRNPDAGAPRYAKGLALFIDKRYEEALPCIARAVDLEPGNYDYSVLRGQVLDCLGMYEEAIGCFNRAIKVGPTNLLAYHYKGEVLMDLKRYDAAAKCFGAEVRIDPNDVDALTCLCHALRYTKKYKDALRYVRMATSLDQQNADLHCMHGDILHSMGKDRKALACYQRAVDLEPDNADMHCALGQMQERLGRINDALESINAAIRLQPDDSNLCIIRASLLSSLGLHEEALADIRGAEEMNDLYPGYLATKGGILESLGRYDEADKCFAELDRIYPNGLPRPE